MNVKQYLAKIGAKGGKAKSAAKTAAARKANAARWHGHKPKRVTATPNESSSATGNPKTLCNLNLLRT
jgi:hypothetical protein